MDSTERSDLDALPLRRRATTTEIAARAGVSRATVSYVLNAKRSAEYRCADQPGLSGVANCVGTTARGGKLDTAGVGIKTFTVDAEDVAGNRTAAHGRGRGR